MQPVRPAREFIPLYTKPERPKQPKRLNKESAEMEESSVWGSCYRDIRRGDRIQDASEELASEDASEELVSERYAVHAIPTDETNGWFVC